jgi:hypothetical protein
LAWRFPWWNPQNPTPTPQRNCTFPNFDQLSAAQQGLLNSVPGGGGTGYYNGLSQAQQANFLNITGALNKASVSVSGLGLAGVETDRLFFAEGTTAAFQASIQTGINSGGFIKDRPIANKHPGMSDFGARQSVTTEALQVGFGPKGAFADIDRGGARTDVVGFLIHMGELATPGSTDPFAVGKSLGSKVTGYTCK